MAQRKNYLGVYDHSKALTFIEDNVKRNGKAGDNKRVLADAEEEYLAVTQSRRVRRMVY